MAGGFCELCRKSYRRVEVTKFAITAAFVEPRLLDTRVRVCQYCEPTALAAWRFLGYDVRRAES